MVSFIVGRAGSGKTHRVISQIKEAEGELILLVPEQYSHTIERLLCAIGGDEISQKAEVLNFKRLADRIFMSAGGLANKTVDNGGRILLMHRAINSVKSELQALSNMALRPEFLKNLVDVVEEIKTCGINYEKLFDLGDGAFEKKLHDIALIATAYEGEFENGMIDPADRLNLAAIRAKETRFFKGKKIWIDGYSGFTQQEIELVRIAFAQCESCTITLCLNDDPEGENGAFAKAWDTYSHLARYAGESEIIRLESGVRYKNKSLAFLEENLFKSKCATGFDDEVEIYRAGGIYDECEIAAAKIIELVQNGIRFKDIAVCARDYNEYAKTLSAVFNRYGVPIYENIKLPVQSLAPTAFVINALRVIADGFRYDDMTAYLKTGLSGVRRRSLDILEQYLYTWHVEGKAWSGEEGFVKNPSGRNEEISDEDKAKLEHLNHLRDKVRLPLINLRQRIKEDNSGSGYARALFEFFEEVHLARRLEARSRLYRNREEFYRAEQYESIWKLLISAIESVSETLGDIKFKVDEFVKIFTLVVSQYEIGTIPTTIDRVNVGGFERMGEAPVKCVIILGAIDGRVPMHSAGKGILSDAEREKLEKLGLGLAQNAEKRLNDEFRLIYNAFTTASDKLVLIVPNTAADGSAARESFIVKRIKAMFPSLEETFFDAPETYAPSSCFDIAAARREHPWRSSARKYFAKDEKYSQRLDLAAKNAKVTRGPIRDRENIDALFGRNIRLSASRTESFNSCRYQYFLKYGLYLKPQRRAAFDALEVGTFTHEILEKTLKEIKARGGHRTVELNEVFDIADRFVEEYVNMKLHGFAGQTARYIEQFKRLRESVHGIVENVHSELKQSLYEPVDFELKFSDRDGDLPALTVNGEDFTVKLEGFVDRVDTCTYDDTLYVRVVDYKTGGKNFRLEEALNGLNMQMLLYLFTICDLGERRYSKKPEAGGVLYLTASEPLFKGTGGETLEEIQQKNDAARVRRGLLLDKPELYEGERFLPIRIKKDGDFDAKSSVASSEDFVKISKRMKGILAQIGRELTSGEISANPYYKNASESACTYCEMRAACHFDPREGDKQRYLFVNGLEDC